MELNAGDKVLVSDINGIKLATVAKVTPTGRIKVGRKYYNPDGCERTQSFWGMSWLKPYSEDAIAEAKEKGVFIDADNNTIN